MILYFQWYLARHNERRGFLCQLPTECLKQEHFFVKNKFKPIEAIDYDEYIERNINSLKKDNLNNLILLPEDDVYVSIRRM